MLRGVLLCFMVLVLGTAAVSAGLWPESGVRRSCAGNRGSAPGVTCVQLHSVDNGRTVAEITKTANTNWCATARITHASGSHARPLCGGRQQDVRWRLAPATLGTVCAWWSTTPGYRACVDPPI